MRPFLVRCVPILLKMTNTSRKFSELVKCSLQGVDTHVRTCCRWPVGGASREEFDHVMISEVGPVRLDHYVSRLEGEIEEIMAETVTRCVEDDGVLTQQTIKETQTFVIRGVVDPRTGHEVRRQTHLPVA